MKRHPRVYVGFPTPGGERRVLIVPLDGQRPPYPLPLRLDIANHSPTGFSWGYLGSGPAQLAVAILADHLSDAAAAFDLHQDFKERIVSCLDQDLGWVLLQDEIDTELLGMKRAA